MTRTYSELSERQELERDTALVKTYLLEGHRVGGADHFGQESDPIVDALADATLRRRFPAEIHPSEDPGLITIDGVFDGREALSLYVDRTDRRYWLIHTMGSSNAADWIIGRLMKAGARIDQVWLPAQLLEALSHLGSFRGLGLDFDRRLFGTDDEEDAAGDNLQFLKMQLWGNRARRVLQVLRHTDAFPDATTLAKVKLKFWPDEEEADLFTLDDIKFDGKVTARGTSFDGHVILLGTLRDTYAREIHKLESRFAIGSDVEVGRLTGRAMSIRLGRSIPDIDHFCATVFSSSNPFRLWGVPLRTSTRFVRVRALDLHVGGPIDFEVASDTIRVFLPHGTCANTIMRFYTNLQHHFDSRVRLLDGEERDVFEF